LCWVSKKIIVAVITYCLGIAGMPGAEKDLVRLTIAGFSRAIILWLLNKNTMSGYALVKELSFLMGQNLSSGIVYPLFYELEDQSYIAGEWSQQGKRRIKHYAITLKGKELLLKLRQLFEMPVKEALRDFIKDEPADSG
jgi:DNA-binding PadR family transcriptional regulator